jgi:hypothetical protein
VNRVSPFLVGLLFGLGLCLSGMTNAARVLAFLDLAGAWDPSLAFVMGGAIVVAFPAFRLAARRDRTLAGGPIDWPTARAIDGRLLGGSLLFGVGWALVGLCPGPGDRRHRLPRRARGAVRPGDGKRHEAFRHGHGGSSRADRSARA